MKLDMLKKKNSGLEKGISSYKPLLHLYTF